jgi:hypothetical protein
MSKPPTLTGDVLNQEPVGYWYDRPNEKIHLVKVLSNPTETQVGTFAVTLRVSVYDAAAAVANRVVNLSDLIRGDLFASDGLHTGNFEVHDPTSFSERYSRLNLPAFNG